MGNHPTTKAGRRVVIDGGPLACTVKAVRPHEAILTVENTSGREHCKYTLESLRHDPTMNEASDFRDH